MESKIKQYGVDKESLHLLTDLPQAIIRKRKGTKYRTMTPMVNRSTANHDSHGTVQLKVL